jgi:hypothetical protein
MENLNPYQPPDKRSNDRDNDPGIPNRPGFPIPCQKIVHPPLRKLPAVQT